MASEAYELELQLHEVREEAAGRLQAVAAGRSLHALDPDQLAQSEAVLVDLTDGYDRRRALSGRPPLGPAGQKELVERLADEFFGFGQLERFCDDREPGCEESSLNDTEQLYLRLAGNRRERRPAYYRDRDELRDFIQRCVGLAGGRIDEAHPHASICLPPGRRGARGSALPACRLTAVLDALSRCHRLTIRVARAFSRTLADLTERGTVEPELADILQAAVRARCNILVSGGTFVGKTNTLRALCGAIPDGERVVTIEEDPELQLEGHVLANCVDLWVRDPNVEGVGAVSVRDLVKLSLRLCPDRIVVGEVRSGEAAVDMLAAMNTGHQGSLCSIHADSARRALAKLEHFIRHDRTQWSADLARTAIADTIDLVVHMTHDTSGRRVVAEVIEVDGAQDGVVQTTQLFSRDDGGSLVRGPVRPRRAAALLRAGWSG